MPGSPLDVDSAGHRDPRIALRMAQAHIEASLAASALYIDQRMRDMGGWAAAGERLRDLISEVGALGRWLEDENKAVLADIEERMGPLPAEVLAATSTYRASVLMDVLVGEEDVLVGEEDAVSEAASAGGETE
jgi:hypothetical protein